MVVKAALNGARSPTDHPALPVSPQAIARDAREVVAAGVQAIHVHARDVQGRESLRPDDVDRCLLACRQAAPGTPIGLSTGAWIAPDLEERLAQLAGWRALPDFVSVNFDEDGAVEVARLIHQRGIGIEVGVSDIASVELALAGGWIARCIRILLEPAETEMEAALAQVEAIERALDRSASAAPRLLHGFDATAWPLFSAAARRGYQSRMGFEDTLRLPMGEVAPSNAQLIQVALALTSPLGRTIRRTTRR